MNLSKLDTIASQHRKSLEAKLKTAIETRANLRRMAEEALATIAQRANTDSEAIAELFLTLERNEDATIMAIRSELGTPVEEPILGEVWKETDVPQDNRALNTLIDMAAEVPKPQRGRPRRRRHAIV